MKLNPFPTSVVLVFAGLSLMSTGCGRDAAHQTSASEPEAVQATTVRAQRVEIPVEVEIFGTVEATRSAAVAARVMAMVHAVHVQAGDTVRRGQLLIEIDPQAAEGQLAQARGALAQAEAAMVLAQRNFERFTALAETQSASELEVDMARMQVEQARGAVEQAKGAVAAASAIAGDTRVVAPFDGRVAQRLVQVGDLAAPGRPLLMIESLAGRRLVASVPESLMLSNRLAKGESVRVHIDSRPDLGDLNATIVEVSPGADPMSHSFRVEVDLALDEVPTGSTGRAWIEAGRSETVVVPATSVLRQGGLHLVVALDEEGRTSSRVVTAGRKLPEGRIEVLSGLRGDETLLDGLSTVPPTGSPVESQR